MMKESKRRSVLPVLFVSVFAIVALWGCPKKAEITATPEPPREEAPAPVQAPPAEQPRQEQQAEKAPAGEAAGEKAAAAAPGLQPVYFDFDRSVIRADAREVLKANAEWLKAHPQAKIRIEGNCDERGTVEYNQALGQRRAAGAKRFLTDLGIAGSRISLISYGKERPACTESSEECWQRNRRDEFVVAAD